jgi:acetoin:2,6-dichlorophenolindophenol oxidoreductase subunit beta
MRRITYQEALVEAIREEMRRDGRVFILGQDVGAFGGFQQSTKGLWEEFGAAGRVIDTPISETAMVGSCIGSAMTGCRPIVEVMAGAFLPNAASPIANDAANVWYYTAGNARAPMVLRTKYGWGPYQDSSQNWEAWFVHVPGLKVVMPSTPYDAKGLMKAAIRDDNPVLFVEHMYLYHGLRGEVPEEDYTVPLGVAEVKRPGRDVTVVATALMLHRAMNVAGELSKEGIEAEIVDPRTLAPLDMETILLSLKKTGRMVVVHEGWKTGSVSGEIASRVAEDGFHHLKAPVIRVGAPHMPFPFAMAFQKAFVPDEAKIKEAIYRVMS